MGLEHFSTRETSPVGEVPGASGISERSADQVIKDHVDHPFRTGLAMAFAGGAAFGLAALSYKNPDAAAGLQTLAKLGFAVDFGDRIYQSGVTVLDSFKNPDHAAKNNERLSQMAWGAAIDYAALLAISKSGLRFGSCFAKPLTPREHLTQGFSRKPDAIPQLFRKPGELEYGIPKFADPNSTSAKIFTEQQDNVVQVKTRTGTGSGFFLDGFVVTAEHVARKGAGQHVVLRDGTTLNTRVVARDVAADIAILKPMTAEGVTLPSAQLGSTRSLQPGDALFGVGHPRGVASPVVAEGSFQHFSVMPDFGTRRNGHVSVLRSSMPTLFGNSGQPIFDSSGRVMSLTSHVFRNLLTEGATAEHIDAVLSVAKNSQLQRGWLDVRSRLNVRDEHLFPLDQSNASVYEKLLWGEGRSNATPNITTTFRPYEREELAQRLSDRVLAAHWAKRSAKDAAAKPVGPQVLTTTLRSVSLPIAGTTAGAYRFSDWLTSKPE